MTPSEPKTSLPDYMTEAYLKPRKQQTVIDLDNFDEVTIRKTGDFTPVFNLDDLHKRIGHNHDTLIRVINDGLRAQEMRQLGETNGSWKIVDDDNKEAGDFVGSPANSKIVNVTVLTLAKTIFGYSDVDTSEHRTAAKEKAKEFIKGNPVIREGLKKSAALRDED